MFHAPSLIAELASWKHMAYLAKTGRGESLSLGSLQICTKVNINTKNLWWSFFQKKKSQVCSSLQKTNGFGAIPGGYNNTRSLNNYLQLEGVYTLHWTTMQSNIPKILWWHKCQHWVNILSSSTLRNSPLHTNDSFY